MEVAMNEPTRARVSVAEMARMVGLSRSRFYQLLGTTFPEPLRDPETNRPFYDEELQQVCLEVRRRNCGIDGRPVMFYARHISTAPPVPKPRRPKPFSPAYSQYDDLLDNVRALGMATTTSEQVTSAVTELFPGGTTDTPEAEVVRAVFVHLNRQESDR